MRAARRETRRGAGRRTAQPRRVQPRQHRARRRGGGGAREPAGRALVGRYFPHVAQRRIADDIVKAGPWIAHAHVAECEIRSAPGVKGDDFGPFLRALKRAGYAGALSLECHWSPSAADMCAEAAQGLQVIRKQLAAAGF